MQQKNKGQNVNVFLTWEFAGCHLENVFLAIISVDDYEIFGYKFLYLQGHFVFNVLIS